MNPLEQLDESLKEGNVARVVIAKQWTSCICLCCFLLCATALTLGLVALLHG